MISLRAREFVNGREAARRSIQEQQVLKDRMKGLLGDSKRSEPRWRSGPIIRGGGAAVSPSQRGPTRFVEPCFQDAQEGS